VEKHTKENKPRGVYLVCHRSFSFLMEKNLRRRGEEMAEIHFEIWLAGGNFRGRFGHGAL